VAVEGLHADHLLAKKEIFKRQFTLIKRLNKEPELAKSLLKNPGMGNFFKKVDGIYYGALYFYELYFNNINNIWLICSACNSKKSDEDAIDWLKNQWGFGEEFFEYLEYQNKVNENIGHISETKLGLAQIAIDWYWCRHGNYMLMSKKLLESIVFPLNSLNRQVDKIGQNNSSAGWHLYAQTEFTKATAQMKGLTSPPAEDEDIDSSTDTEDWRKKEVIDGKGELRKVNRSLHNKAVDKFAQGFSKNLYGFFKENLSIEAIKRDNERKNETDNKRANAHGVKRRNELDKKKPFKVRKKLYFEDIKTPEAKTNTVRKNDVAPLEKGFK
jgi:hypothetical protein